MAMKRLLLIISFVCTICSGCSRKTVSQIVSTDNTKQDSAYQSSSNVQHVIERDSIYIDRWHTEWIKGDTVHHRDSIYCYVEKAVHDTINTTDTVYMASKETSNTNKESQTIQEREKKGGGLWIFFAGILSAIAVYLAVKLCVSKWRK